MREACPDLSTHQALPDGRTWTASCESINPRHDVAFYVIDFWKQETCDASIMVSVYAGLSHEQLLSKLARLAQQGVPNTDYGGSTLWRRQRSRQGLPLPDGLEGMVTRFQS